MNSSKNSVPGALPGKPATFAGVPARATARTLSGVAGELGYAVCSQCRSSPATAVSFKCRTGLPMFGTDEDRQATLCRECGLSVGRDLMNRDMLWSAGRLNKLRSVARMLHNRRELARVRKLTSPRAVTGSQVGVPLRPRRSVALRLGTMVVLAQLVLAVAAGSVAWRAIPDMLQDDTVSTSTTTQFPTSDQGTQSR